MRGGSVRSGGRVFGPGRAFGPVRARHRWLSSAALLDNYLRYMCCSSIAVAGFLSKYFPWAFPAFAALRN